MSDLHPVDRVFAMYRDAAVGVYDRLADGKHHLEREAVTIHRSGTQLVASAAYLAAIVTVENPSEEREHG